MRPVAEFGTRRFVPALLLVLAVVGGRAAAEWPAPRACDASPADVSAATRTPVATTPATGSAGSAARTAAAACSADATGAGATGARAGAMRVYRDPTTGALGAPPPEALPPAAARAFATSAHGLVETAGTSRAGGVKIDLGGQFQSAVSATAGGDGRLRTDCHAADVAR